LSLYFFVCELTLEQQQINYITVDIEMPVTMSTKNHQGHNAFFCNSCSGHCAFFVATLQLLVQVPKYTTDHKSSRRILSASHCERCASFVTVVTLHL